MKKLKMILALTMIVALLAGNLPAAVAAGAPTFEVGTAEAKAGETVEVQVYMKDSPGICSLSLDVACPGLTLVGFAAGEMSVVGPQPTALAAGVKDAFKIVMALLDNVSGSRTMATLTFEIKEDAAPGFYPIEISYDPDDVYGVDPSTYMETNVDFDVVNGGITVQADAVAVAGVSLDKNALSLKLGDSAQLTAAVSPADAANKNVFWSSSNEAVATVDPYGRVIAVAEGTAVVTVTTEDGGKTAQCTVTVSCAHAGGEATCTDKAVCVICGKEYGEAKGHQLTKHDKVDADHTKAGNIEYWTCDVCGKYFADAAATSEITKEETVIAQIPHSFASAWKNDAGQHWKECSCGAKKEVAAHQYDGPADASCNVCDYNRTVVHNWDSEYSFDGSKHWIECSHCDQIKGEEAHKGGAATCTDKAVCEVCGQAYGEAKGHKLTKHDKVNADHLNAGNIEYWTCDVCGKYFADAAATNEITKEDTVIERIPHSFASSWKNDAEQHWKECSCGAKKEVAAHQYDGPADASCNVCDYNRTVVHNWDSDYSYDAEKHWIECSHCDQIKGEEAHKGGAATCTDKAVCEVCGQAYGEAKGHKLTKHDKVDADHTKAGNIEYWTCDVCGKYFADAAATSEITKEDTVIAQLPHSFASAWKNDAEQHWKECSCGAKKEVAAHKYDGPADATCNECGYNRTVVHNWDSDYSYDAEKHWIECSHCDEIKGEEAHKGGKATCTDKAVCEVCGQAYGEAKGHKLTKHDKVDADHTKAGNIEYWTCDVCGKYFADAAATNEITKEDTVIAQLPHSYSDAWKNDAEQHWKECSCGAKKEVADHQYDGPADAYCNICDYNRTVVHDWDSEYSFDAEKHWIECSHCDEIKGEEAHKGGEATCTDKAVCEVCGQSYGELAECDFSVEKAEAKYLKEEATCVAPAVYYKSCAVCGEAGTETFTLGEVDADNHVGETELKGKLDATCTEDGYTGDTCCVSCGAKLAEGEVIPAAHKLEKIGHKDATHTADGNIEHYACAVCEKLYADSSAAKEVTAEEVVIPMIPHDYKPGQDEENHFEVCECGDKINVEAHTGDWTIIKEAEVGVAGSKERVCTKCGYKQVVEIPAIGTPSTGDESNLVLWMALMVISACGMTLSCLMIPRKKGKYLR